MGSNRKSIDRLTLKQIRSDLSDGYYGDGNNLYLRVSNAGQSRSWSFRYQSPLSGRQRDFTIGKLKYLDLKEARNQAIILQKMIIEGLDPANEHHKKKRGRKEASLTNLKQEEIAELRERKRRKTVTFETAALAFIEMKQAEWKDRRAKRDWISSMERYVFPYIGTLSVDKIGDDEVLEVLRPIWEELSETALRLRWRLKAILDYAKAEKWRTGDNPAGPHSALKFRLPNIRTILARKRKHYYALPAKDIPDTMRYLKEAETTVTKVIRFLILTGGRSMEIREARWEEIDLEEKLWKIPASRMKTPKEHTVPLVKEAIKILKEVYYLSFGKGLIFRNRVGNPYSDASLTKAIKKASGDKQATIHGLRSTLWDWAAENKVVGYHAIQATFAHTTARTVADAAYFRSDLLKERRVLLEAWEKFCLGRCEMT